MPEYSYIAQDKAKKLIRGEIVSPNPESVIKTLATKDLEIISCNLIKEAKKGLNIDVLDLAKGLLFRKITSLEKISFATHLGVMFKAGVPVTEAIDALTSDSSSPKFKKLIKNIITELEKGKTLSSILETENFFSKAHMAILQAGESSGNMAEVLERIARDLKRDFRIQRKVKGAMAYPMIILMALLAVSLFVIIFVLPKVGDVFKQMDIKIPLPTLILLSIGTFLSTYFKQVIMTLIALVIGLILFLRINTSGGKVLMRIISSLPIIKGLIKEMNLAHFIRSLSALLSSGVPITESLEMGSNIFVEKKSKNAVLSVAGDVKKGVSLTNAFKSYQKVFGGLLIKMTAVGEKSGKLSEILEELAVFYEEDLEDKLENFTTIIEPVLMLLVGIGVGGMILTIIGPIYQMMGQLSQ